MLKRALLIGLGVLLLGGLLLFVVARIFSGRRAGPSPPATDVSTEETTGGDLGGGGSSGTSGDRRLPDAPLTEEIPGGTFPGASSSGTGGFGSETPLTAPETFPSDTGSSASFPLIGPSGSASSFTIRSGVCPAQWANQPDGDADQLPDAVETIYQTTATNRDTDGDGFPDGEEVRNGYDPRQAGSARLDSDDDGLLDHEECQWRTDPFVADTDGDGFQDGAEVKNGFDPTVRGDGQGSDALSGRGAGGPFAPQFPVPPPPPAAPDTGFGGLFDIPPDSGGGARIAVPPGQLTEAVTQAPTDIAIPPVEPSEIRQQESNTAADARNYLQALRGIRPSPLLTTASLTSALTKSFSGQPQELAQVRRAIDQYESDLLAVPTPENASAHHTLHISLVRFVNDRLGVIEQNAATDPVRAYTAAREIQDSLPPQLRELQSRLQAVQRTAGGG